MTDFDELRQTKAQCLADIREALPLYANRLNGCATAIACIKERRHFIGFELSKEYFDKACKRIKAEQQQLTLF